MIKENIKILLERLKREIINFYGARLLSLVVFGSAAKGTMRPDSDLDFLICVKDLPRGRKPRLKEFQKIENSLELTLRELSQKGINTVLSPVIKTPEEVEFGSVLFIDMIDNAIILYDHQSFFKEYLNKLRAKLVEMGSKKVKFGDLWFWDLIPNYRLVKEVSF